MNGMTESTLDHSWQKRAPLIRGWNANRQNIGFLALIFALAFPSSGILRGDDETASDPIKVLLIDGQNNHDWQGCSPVMMDTLEVTGRFKVDRATVKKGEVADFSPDFTQYDVVLSNYNGEPWTEKTKAAFVKYIEEGGNLVVVHAADNSFPHWKEFNAMTGLGGWEGRNEKDGPYVYWKNGKFVRDGSKGVGGSHGRSWTYKVIVRDKDHPITRGLPE